jgi:orotate phosphoribosyltransferase
VIDPDVLERINRGILLRTGAFLTNDHFVLSSGRHAEEYLAKILITTEPSFTEGIGDLIAKNFGRARVDLVATTGYGASVLGHCVARAHPSRPRFVYGIKLRHPDGRIEVRIPREYHPFFAEGSRCLIVEDILSTGESVRRLIEAVRAMGVEIVGIGSLWKRRADLRFKYPVLSLITKNSPTFRPSECPMCRKGIPINQNFGRGEMAESELAGEV